MKLHRFTRMKRKGVLREKERERDRGKRCPKDETKQNKRIKSILVFGKWIIKIG